MQKVMAGSAENDPGSHGVHTSSVPLESLLHAAGPSVPAGQAAQDPFASRTCPAPHDTEATGGARTIISSMGHAIPVGILGAGPGRGIRLQGPVNRPGRCVNQFIDGRAAEILPRR